MTEIDFLTKGKTPFELTCFLENAHEYFGMSQMYYDKDFVFHKKHTQKIIPVRFNKCLSEQEITLLNLAW